MTRRSTARRAAALAGVLVLTTLGCTAKDDPAPPDESTGGGEEGLSFGPVEWSWQQADLGEIRSVSVGPRLVVAQGLGREGDATVAAFQRGGDEVWRLDGDSFDSPGRRGLLDQGALQGESDSAAVVVGVVMSDRRGGDQAVIGLAPDTGDEAWRYRPSGAVDLVGGAGDVAIVTTAGSDGGCGSQETTVGLDMTSGEMLWSGPALCDAFVDDERLVAGDRVIDPSTGDTVATAPGPVCGVTDDYALWMPECPFETALVTARPEVISLSGATAGLPSFSEGRVSRVVAGLGVIAVTYLPSSTGMQTSSWVAGGSAPVESDQELRGGFLSTGTGGVVLDSDGVQVRARGLTGAEVSTWPVPEELQVPGAGVHVDGLGPDYVLLAPSNGGRGQVVVRLSTDTGIT